MKFLTLVVVGVVLAYSEARRREGRIPLKRCRLGDETCYPSKTDLCKLREGLSPGGRLILPDDVDYRNIVLMKNRITTKFPGLIVQVGSVEDVQKAVKFAKHHNLALSVRDDANDPIGRSTNNGGMIIDMSAFKSISTMSSSPRQAAGEVKVSAGNTWGEIYNAVDGVFDDYGNGTVIRRLVVGSRYRDDAAGRFTLGGGISPLSRLYGLAVDNLLEITLVNAHGKVVTVSADGAWWDNMQLLDHKDWQNMGLFWALRGAGSGAFGVVVSLTFKLHFAPINMYEFSVSHVLYENGQFRGKQALKDLLIQAKNLPTVYGGQITLEGGNQVTPDREGQIDWHLLQATDVNSPFSAIGNTFVAYNASGTLISPAVPNVRQTWKQYVDNIPTLMPQSVHIVNTLIQPEVIDDPEKLDQLADLMLSVVNHPTVDSRYQCTGTLLGGVIGSVPLSATAVNAHLRSAFMSLTCTLSIPDNACDRDVYHDSVNSLADRMSELGGGMYYNEASTDLEDWKDALYGDNYGHLVDVKRYWDNDNFFYCDKCVASDFRFDCFRPEAVHHFKKTPFAKFMHFSPCSLIFDD